jgi:hypothetical protein
MVGCIIAAAGTENNGGPAVELRFPRRDLIAMDVELPRQPSRCSVALQAASATFALKAGA